MCAQYASEELTDALWDELQPLLQKHYHEIAHYSDIPLEPDRESYARLVGLGMFRVYTARVGGALVGYLAVIVSRSMHYKSALYANQDVLYVDPRYRGSRVGVRLIQYAHRALAADGVTVFFQHVKHREDLNIGPLLKRLGYEPIDDIWGIRLDRKG